MTSFCRNHRLAVTLLLTLLAVASATAAGVPRAAPVGGESDTDDTDCVGCRLASHASPKLVEHLKVEAIKEQILSKLHMKARPNITHAMPKELLTELLKRVDRHDNRRPWLRRSRHPKQHRPGAGQDTSAVMSLLMQADSGQQDMPQAAAEGDDFYSKTSEVIAFAEPGKCRTCRVMHCCRLVRCLF